MQLFKILSIVLNKSLLGKGKKTVERLKSFNPLDHVIEWVQCYLYFTYSFFPISSIINGKKTFDKCRQFISKMIPVI